MLRRDETLHEIREPVVVAMVVACPRAAAATWGWGRWRLAGLERRQGQGPGTGVVMVVVGLQQQVMMRLVGICWWIE